MLRLDTRDCTLTISSNSSLFTVVSPFSLPELDIEHSRYAASNTLGFRSPRTPPKRRTVRWLHDDVPQDVQASGCTDISEKDSRKENAPQIVDFEPSMEPLGLLETLPFCEESTTGDSNGETDDLKPILSHDSVRNVTDAEDDSKDRSKMSGVQNDLATVRLSSLISAYLAVASLS